MATNPEQRAPEDLMYEVLSRRMGLDKRTITFHIMDDEFGGGLINDIDRLQDSDTLYVLGDICWDQPEIVVCDVTTYQLGNGESDDASFTDCTRLKDADIYNHPVFNAMLAKYADVLCSLHDITLYNPAYTYTPDDESDDEE